MKLEGFLLHRSVSDCYKILHVVSKNGSQLQGDQTITRLVNVQKQEHKAAFWSSSHEEQKILKQFSNIVGIFMFQLYTFSYPLGFRESQFNSSSSLNKSIGSKIPINQMNTPCCWSDAPCPVFSTPLLAPMQSQNALHLSVKLQECLLHKSVLDL